MPVAYLAIVPQECGISYIFSTCGITKSLPLATGDEKGGSVLR